MLIRFAFFESSVSLSAERALSCKVFYLLRHFFLRLRQNTFAWFRQHAISTRLFSCTVHSISTHYRCKILDPDVQEGHAM